MNPLQVVRDAEHAGNLAALHEVWAVSRADPAFRRLRESGSRLVPGVGNPVTPPIVFIGEAPGANEDEAGQPFIGAAGRILNDWIWQLGLERAQVWITNAVKFRPTTAEGRNRPPSRAELIAGRVHLRAEMKIVRPRLIVPLGAHALWLVRPDPITQVHGQVFTRSGGQWTYCPLYHPAYVLRDPRKQADVDVDLKTIRTVLAGQSS